MAEVWEGRDEVLSRPVAVKLLMAHLATDGTFIERFRREAVSAARLTHPGVVATYDTGTDGGTAWIVMELVRGDTLRHLLNEHGPMDPATALDIGAQIADALAHAHRAGLVHRDIKPANILLVDHDGEARVKVTDFGIAKATEGLDLDLTKTGIVLGTPKYLSPEQVEGHEPDARADLYSLGVVLFEMLTGRPPFEGPTDMATAIAHIRQAPPAPSQYRDDLPSAVDDVVAGLLVKDPTARIPTAAAVRTRLADLAVMLSAGRPRRPQVRVESTRQLGVDGAAAVRPFDVDAGAVAVGPFDVDGAAAGAVAVGPFDVDAGAVAVGPFDVDAGADAGAVAVGPFDVEAHLFDVEADAGRSVGPWLPPDLPVAPDRAEAPTTSSWATTSPVTTSSSPVNTSPFPTTTSPTTHSATTNSVPMAPGRATTTALPPTAVVSSVGEAADTRSQNAGGGATAFGSAPDGDLPAMPTRRRSRRRWVPTVVVAAILAAGAAVGAVLLMQGGRPLVATGGSLPSPVPAATISGVTVWMMSNRTPDNPGETPLTFDGNPATGWFTDLYNTSTFGGLYSGYGLAIHLSHSSTLHELAVTSPTRGWSASVYVATNEPSTGQPVAAWGKPTDTRSGLDGSATFSLGPSSGSWVLLWLTNLGPTFRAEVQELRVT